MPVSGTPDLSGTVTSGTVVVSPNFVSSGGRDCSSMTNIVPAITKAFGSELLGRMRSASIKQTQTATIYVQMVDSLGDPIDLSTCSTLTLKGRFREVINPSDAVSSSNEVVGSFADTAAGYIALDVPETISKVSGIYYAEIGVFDAGTNKLKSSNTIYLFVEPNLFGGMGPRLMYPLPTIQEARIRLRDSGPEENLLLRELEFDLTELCDALINCVNWWNTAQPPIDIYFTTTNYPFYHPSGYVSYLMRMSAIRYMRNHLDYSAAGVTIDDQNKFGPYLQAAKLMQEEYEGLILQKKASINMNMAMTSSGSPYGGWYSY